MQHPVYLDNQATTPIDPRVLEAMMPYMTEHFGNAGSIGHRFGEIAREAVQKSRETIAGLLNVAASEIVFTSGATESNNLAIRGIADRLELDASHFVSVETEHKAVLDPLQRLARRGADVELVKPVVDDPSRVGMVEPASIANALRESTRLVSVMSANNEIGVLTNIREIADECHRTGVFLHCDATQAIGKIPVNVDELGCDLLSFSGHKIYGPRGMGVLVVRRRRPRVRLSPLIDGGGQEGGRRSGTLNVPGIVGLATALQICVDDMDADRQRATDLRQRLYDGLTEALDDIELNGPAFAHRLAGNLNLRFEGVDGEALMMNMEELAVSSGSACTSANPEPSHVLRSIGLSEDQVRSSLRFGIGRFNTDNDVDIAVETVTRAVKRLRSLG